jgi:hypothetical protein
VRLLDSYTGLTSFLSIFARVGIWRGLIHAGMRDRAGLSGIFSLGRASGSRFTTIEFIRESLDSIFESTEAFA